MAATQADGEAGPDVARSPGGDLELLSNQGATGRGGGGKWKHQGTATARTWLSRSQLFAAEGTAVGGHQDPIHRFTESCLKCGRRQILVQNRFFIAEFFLVQAESFSGKGPRTRWTARRKGWKKSSPLARGDAQGRLLALPKRPRQRSGSTRVNKSRSHGQL